MPPQLVKVRERIRFGEDFEFDLTARRLTRGNRVLKVERIPLEILALLIECWGKTVPRDEIVARVWGKGAFLDTDNSIRGAIRKIRQVLKDDPEQPHFIQTITGEGYRFIAPLSGVQEEVGVPEEGAAGPPSEQTLIAGAPVQVEREPRTRIRRGHWRLVLPAAAGLMLLVITYVFWHRPTGQTAPKIKSIAVLPMKNLSGDPAQEYLSDGMTEEIIGRLAGVRSLRVISRTSVMHFKESPLSLPEIARLLGVDALVEGSVIREHSRIRVHAQLIRAATDEHLWSESYDRELGDVLALESDVAESIVRKIDVSVSGQERSRVVTALHVSPEVYEIYWRGQFAFNKKTRSDIEESIHYFEQALNADPDFAPAYVAMAHAYGELGTVFRGGAPPGEARAKVIWAAQKALQLDPQLADAHVILADVYQEQWHWVEAEEEYKRAFELAPNNVAAHRGFAGWLACKGRTAEAVEWAKRARELDPLVPSDLDWILFLARRYDEAARELHATMAVTPDDPDALWGLGFVLIAENKAADAIPPLEKALAITHGGPGVKGVLVRAYAGAGRRKDALRLLEELRRQSQTEYVPAGALVQAYVGIGDKEQAFAWLERSYEEQSNLLQWLKTENTFDPLRSDPRFTDLLHRMGLD